MSKMFKKIICVVVSVLFLISAGIGTLIYLNRRKMTIPARVGDIIQFGAYPQEIVEDDTLIRNLEQCTFSWKDYGYYRGSVPTDIMEYADISYGAEKYRAVRLNGYRMTDTSISIDWWDSDDGRDSSVQDDNGFVTDTVYWFRYLPLDWVVLDPVKGLVMSANIVDAQPFNNAAYNNLFVEDDSDYYADIDYTMYANDYGSSDIRTWLNTDFVNTAFSDEEKGKIRITNPDEQTSNSESNIQDYVYLPSIEEIQNEDYGMYNRKKDTYSVKMGETKYANCQGLKTKGEYSYINIMTRTPNNLDGEVATDSVLTVELIDESTGEARKGWEYVQSTCGGICPMIVLSEQYTRRDKETLTENETNTADNGSVFLGSYPQSQVKDSTLINQLNKQKLTWQSYGYYYSPEDTPIRGDYMQYADVTMDGTRYRAVRFTEYRPYSTSSNSSDVLPGSENEKNEKQYINGFRCNTVYWFRFEQIEWVILDAEKGLLITKYIQDAQPFCNDGQADEICKYSFSSVREWLNTTFYNTAFNSSEKNNIKTSTVQTPSIGKQFPECEDEDVQDKVFLLSFQEIDFVNGFAQKWYEQDETRRAVGTDYAFCQGLSKEENGCSKWQLRTALVSGEECVVSDYGFVPKADNGFYPNTDWVAGIRPVVRVDSKILKTTNGE